MLDSYCMSGIVQAARDSKVPFIKNFKSHKERQEFREHTVSFLCPGPFTRAVLCNSSFSLPIKAVR